MIEICHKNKTPSHIHSYIALFFRTTRFLTFPDYLMVQVKKFTLGEDWVPKKLGQLSLISLLIIL